MGATAHASKFPGIRSFAQRDLDGNSVCLSAGSILIRVGVGIADATLAVLPFPSKRPARGANVRPDQGLSVCLIS